MPGAMVGSATACFTVLLGFALIGVGAVVLRKANPTSGYLYIAAGAVMVLFNCCTFMVMPSRLIGAGLDYDMISLVMMALTLARGAQSILVSILIAVALVGVAKKVPAPAA